MAQALTRFASGAATLAGHYATSLLAMMIVAGWVVAGPLIGFSDTWLILAGTGTSIVAFLMVFLIQHTQNRDAVAVHLKLDELLRAVEGANTSLIRVEDETDEELGELKRLYAALCEERDELKTRLARDANGLDRSPDDSPRGLVARPR
jgi:low affinity Fe/Cu permease